MRMGDMKRMCSWTTRKPCLVCACVPIFEVVKGTLASAIHLPDTHLHESLLVRRSKCYVLFEEIIPSHGELFSCQGKLSTCVSTLQGFITEHQNKSVLWVEMVSSHPISMRLESSSMVDYVLTISPHSHPQIELYARIKTTER